MQKAQAVNLLLCRTGQARFREEGRVFSPVLPPTLRMNKFQENVNQIIINTTCQTERPQVGRRAERPFMRGTSLPGGDPGEGSAEAVGARGSYLPRLMGFLSWLLYRVILWLWIKFKGCFILDLRSIAFYRILMGCTLIGDLIDRGRDLIFHYSDEGLNPRNLVFEKLDDASYSIYFINGTPAGMCYHRASLYPFPNV